MKREGEETKDDNHLPHWVVDYGNGQEAFSTMREEFADLSELSCDGPSERFAATTSMFHMSSALLLEGRFSRLHQDRSPLLVARAGVDHYIATVYLKGFCHYQLGSRDLLISPGDVGIVDMAYPSRTLIAPAGDDRFAHFITMFLPRAVLAPLLPGRSEFGQHLIRGDQPYGRILRTLLLDWWRHAEDLSMAESEPVVKAAATLVAGGVGLGHGSAVEVGPAMHGATRAAIQGILERTDTTPDETGVAALCRRFGISRATLYRMFEPDGGLVHYMRERQLRRAMAVLVSPAHRHRKLVDIALQHGFNTEWGFIRAFRRRFGVSPGEVRDEPSLAQAAPNEGGQSTRSWILALSTPAAV